MGDQANLGPFVAEDSFLRRIDRKRYVMDGGLVGWGVFQPREQEPSLSFTYQGEELKTDEGLSVYHEATALPSGDLPGICKLTFYDLSQSLDPPLPPRSEPDHADKDYGHLHCSTDCPRGQLHMEQMAKLASRNGLLRPFVRSRKKYGGGEGPLR